MRPIQYIDYDKLSDDVLFLGDDLYLRMNVTLSNKSDDKRYHFHKEFKYSSKYSESGLISIKRSYTYYLTLDRKTTPGGGVMIRAQDMIILREKLNEVATWFTDTTVFGKRGSKLIAKKVKPVVISGLANGKFLEFDPIVIVYENTGAQSPGVRITMGSVQSAWADIDVERFFALLYTINSFDMYLAAQNLINYLGRPNFGMNMYEVDEMINRVPNQTDEITGGEENRTIPQKNKSFFDKMNDLNKGGE